MNEAFKPGRRARRAGARRVRDPRAPGPRDRAAAAAAPAPARRIALVLVLAAAAAFGWEKFETRGTSQREGVNDRAPARRRKRFGSPR